jgi:hypothetical protein
MTPGTLLRVIKSQFSHILQGLRLEEKLPSSGLMGRNSVEFFQHYRMHPWRLNQEDAGYAFYTILFFRLGAHVRAGDAVLN